MTIYIIEEYLRQNPNHKVMVLAHGTTILRTQFHDVLEKYNPEFTYNLIQSCKDYENSTAQVNVCLPQTLVKCKLTNTNLLVVDEAHQFYFATMVKNIIKKTRVKKQLLLTGTPSQFILKKFHIIPVSLNTIFDAGMISDIYVELASSSYNFDFKDYNTYDELKSTVRFNKSATKKTMDDLVGKIVEYLKSIRGNEYTNLVPEWIPTLKRLKKTMIACKSQNQAKQLQNYFDKIGVKSALSISDTDIESEEIERFKSEEDVLVLIVVGRGILGFNFPELVNVVDMTMSYNVDRIYQLFCRVARQHPDGDKKLFFKIAPNMLSDYFKHIMTAVLMLSDDNFFMKYNGKNFDDMEIPVRKSNEPRGVGHTDTITKKKQKKYQTIDMGGLPVFEFFQNILHKKDEVLSVYAMTTIKDVRAQFMNNLPKNFYTREKCQEDALKYQTKSEFSMNSSGSYHASKYYGILDDICSHMTGNKRYNTKEKCQEAALKCKTRTEFHREYGAAAYASKRNGWYNEIISHMIETKKPNGYWTKEKCQEAAMECTTKGEFGKRFSNAYAVSRKNGWYDEIITHMKTLTFPSNYWTKEKCQVAALKCKTRTEFNDKYGSAYGKALKNRWIDEICSHMIEIHKPDGFWVKEKCEEAALKCKTRSEFYKKYGTAYNNALKNKYLDEICSHMKK
jgi:hypothetical protein